LLSLELTLPQGLRLPDGRGWRGREASSTSTSGAARRERYIRITSMFPDRAVKLLQAVYQSDVRREDGTGKGSVKLCKILRCHPEFVPQSPQLEKYSLQKPDNI